MRYVVTLYKLESSIAFKVIFLEGLCGIKRKCVSIKKREKKLPTFVSFHSQWLPETKFLLPLLRELLKPVCYLRHICSVRGFSKQMKQRAHDFAKKKKNPSRIVLPPSLYSQPLPFPSANHAASFVPLPCVGQRGAKSEKKLFKPALWSKSMYQDTIVWQMFFIYICIFRVHTKMLTISPENSKPSPKKGQEIKSAV